MELTIQLQSYIAAPYWPELSDIIDIQKRCWSPRMKEATRAAALEAHLEKQGLGKDYYDKLVERAARKWYKNDTGNIFIPRHQIAGMLVQTVKRGPKPIKAKFTPDSFRSLVRISDFITERKDKDEVFDRYVKNDLTNQRRRQIDEVIKDFNAVGTITLDETVDEEDFLHLLAYGLFRTGLGSARKMGYGRGTIIEPKLKSGLNYKELDQMVEKEEPIIRKVKVDVYEAYSGTELED